MNTTQTPVAVVTGAANGIGCATALLLAVQGARVLGVDRDAGGLDSLVKEIRGNGQEAQSFAAGVSDSSDVQAYVQRALKSFGLIDCFFNNAGMVGQLALLVDNPSTPLTTSSP